MEAKIASALKNIGYAGTLLDKETLLNEAELGAKSLEYTALVSFVCNELKVVCNLDEQVNPITNVEDSITFLMELSSFLKELGCPYSSLTQGHISDRLNTLSDKLLLLDYLLTELMGARILREKKPEKKIELKLQETSQGADMRKMLMTLGFPKPPPNITVQRLFEKLIPTVQSVVQKAGNDLLGNSIFNGFLSQKQWATLEDVHQELNQEYTIRREMLLKRLDCTIQSFEWSEKTKGKEEMIEAIYADKRKSLKVEPEVHIADLLSARDDMAIIVKTSNANVRKNTQSEINKVLIGQVPDRGGRTSEQAPPPPEMPSWQQRQPGPGGRGGGFGGGQFSRGRGGARGDSQQQNNFGRSFDSAGSYGGNNYSASGGQEFNRVGYVSNKSGTSGASSSFSFMSKDFGSSLKNFNTSLSGYSTSSKSFDSAGSFGGYKKYTNNSYGNNPKNSKGSFDSAGSFGGTNNSQNDVSEPKRAKTYDSFQTNKTTYADQYVQESQHNQQYRPQSERGRGRGGRSNYRRGGNQTYR